MFLLAKVQNLVRTFVEECSINVKRAECHKKRNDFRFVLPGEVFLLHDQVASYHVICVFPT
jgi:hypothetical protein